MKRSATLSLRIDFPGGGRLGPGKAALLQGIADTGSIRSAAEELGMSYPKALKLIEQLNTDFRDPLIHSHHGGHERGGSELTATGEAVLAAYRAVCAKAEAATDTERQAITSLLAAPKRLGSL